MMRRAIQTIRLIVLLLVAHAASAQDYPNKPVRLIVPWPPGGISDTSARLLAQHLSPALGQQILVDNRAGAGSTIGADLVAKAAPDGYTLLYTDVTAQAINATLYTRLAYDTVKDFTMITMVGASPLYRCLHPSLPARSVAELIAVAKAKPGTINYASAGNGSTLHLAAELFRSEAGINIVHVPYKGSGAAMGSLLSGEVIMIFSAAPPVLPHISTGALLALATTAPA